jgi:hypothetical protein
MCDAFILAIEIRAVGPRAPGRALARCADRGFRGCC